MLKSDYHYPGCTTQMRHSYMGISVHWVLHAVGSSTHIFPPHLWLTYLGVQYYALVLPVRFSLYWTSRPLSTGWCHEATMSKPASVVVVVDKEDLEVVVDLVAVMVLDAGRTNSVGVPIC
jgi:hypothetical protein